MFSLSKFSTYASAHIRANSFEIPCLHSTLIYTHTNVARNVHFHFHIMWHFIQLYFDNSNVTGEARGWESEIQIKHFQLTKNETRIHKWWTMVAVHWLIGSCHSMYSPPKTPRTSYEYTSNAHSMAHKQISFFSINFFFQSYHFATPLSHTHAQHTEISADLLHYFHFLVTFLHKIEMKRR